MKAAVVELQAVRKAVAAFKQLLYVSKRRVEQRNREARPSRGRGKLTSRGGVGAISTAPTDGAPRPQTTQKSPQVME